MLIIIAISLLVALWLIVQHVRDRKLLNTVTKPYRGTKTERNLVVKLLKHGVPAQTIFHDLYVKNNQGNFSQIDLVVATKVGIIVFEVKEMQGWIFGSGNHQQWTQVLASGKKKYRFYNPIRQNNSHISQLKKQLVQFEAIPFYSIIVFYGKCSLKEVNYVPQGTLLVKSKRVLEAFRKVMTENAPAQYTNKKDVVRVLEEAVRNGENPENTTRHIEHIRDVLGKERIFD